MVEKQRSEQGYKSCKLNFCFKCPSSFETQHNNYSCHFCCIDEDDDDVLIPFCLVANGVCFAPLLINEIYTLCLEFSYGQSRFKVKDNRGPVQAEERIRIFFVLWVIFGTLQAIVANFVSNKFFLRWYKLIKLWFIVYAIQTLKLMKSLSYKKKY